MDVSKVISRATDLGTGMTVFFIRTYLIVSKHTPTFEWHYWGPSPQFINVTHFRYDFRSRLLDALFLYVTA